ncbi:MAG: YihY/virulence factor BrkB family protein [Pseudomonadota bacterium]
MARGRDANSPMTLGHTGWLDVAMRVWNRLGTLHIGLLAAGVAFYGLLSLFPAITAGVAITGLVFDPANLVDQAQWLLSVLPPSAADLIERQLSEVAGAEQGALGLAALISLAIALWSSSNATGSLVQGLNVIYEEEDTRGFVKTRLLIIGLTVAMIIGLALAIAVVAAIPATLALMGAGPAIIDAALFLRWPLMFILGAVGIAALYRYGPDRRHARWRWLTPGAFIGCTLWVAGTVAFSTYVQSFANYNETFGALTGVIVLLTWFWLSAFVVLLGAQLDAELEAQTARDSTVGKERPMGQRGAVKADTVGQARGAQDDEGAEPSSFTAR